MKLKCIDCKKEFTGKLKDFYCCPFCGTKTINGENALQEVQHK